MEKQVFKINSQSWRTTEMIRQSWQQKKKAKWAMDVTTLRSRRRFLVTNVPSTQNSSKTFSTFETEPNVLLRGTRVWLPASTEDWADQLHVSHSELKSALKQFEISKKHNKTKHSPYSLILLQLKFKLQYQNEKTPKYWCLSFLSGT